MQVRRFSAPTLLRAMNKAQAACGSDAVILQQTERRYRWQWWQPAATVTVALDDPRPARRPTALGAPSASAPPPPRGSEVSQDFVAFLKATLEETAPNPPRPSLEAEPRPASAENPEPARPDPGAALGEGEGEVATALEASLASANSPPSAEGPPPAVPPRGPESLRPGLDELTVTTLHEVRTMLRALHPVLAPSPVVWPATLPLQLLAPTGAQRICVVGPTGAGKTTTIGKLAAQSRLLDQLPVHLLTADTFRAGAVAQLEAFAHVLKVPCTVLREGTRCPLPPADQASRWFLDTPGLTQHDRYHRAEIAAWIAEFNPTQAYVVLPATLRPESFERLAEYFGTLVTHPALILTKVDETDDLSALLAPMERLGWAWSYVGTGQSVPDDLQVADPQRLQAWGGSSEPWLPAERDGT